MATDNFRTIINNLDVPVPTSLASEPIYAFQVTETKVFIETKIVPIGYTESTFSFFMVGDEKNLEVVLFDSTGTDLGFTLAVDPDDPQVGEWVATYDGDSNKTTFTFYFTDSASILDAVTLSLFSDTVGGDSVTLTGNSYEKFITNSGLSISEKSKLIEIFRKFFLQSNGSSYAKLYLFNTFAQLKNFQMKIANPDIVAMNFFSVNLPDFNDANNNFRYILRYNGETPSELTTIASTYKNRNGSGNVIFVQSEQLFLPAFCSAYYGAVSGFLAANPTGLILQGILPITDPTRISFYKDNNILFLTLANETQKDQALQIKNGVQLDGLPIDLVTTLNAISISNTQVMQAIYFRFGQNNSKISKIESEGKKTSIYQSEMELNLKKFQDAEAIISYKFLGFTVTQTQELSVSFNLSIVYNKSINVLISVIDNQAPTFSILAA